MLRIYGFTLLCFASVYTLSSLALVGIFAGKWNVGLQVQGNGMISLCIAAGVTVGFFAGSLLTRHLQSQK